MRKFLKLLPRVLALSIVLISATSFTQIDNLNQKVCAAVGVDECISGVFKNGTTGSVKTTACRSASDSVQYLCVDPTKPDLGANSPSSNTGNTMWVKQSCATGKFCVGNTCQVDTTSNSNLNTGVSCIQNYASCPGGQSNFSKILATDSISTVGTKFTGIDLQTAIQKQLNNLNIVGSNFTPDPNGVGHQIDIVEKASTKVCISDSKLSNLTIFPYEGGTDNANYETPAGFNSTYVKDLKVTGTIPAYCGPGYQPSLNSQQGATFNGGASQTWGCCKSGYQFITIGGTGSVENVGNSACCLIRDNVSAPYNLHIQNSQGPQQCINKDGNSVWGDQTEFAGQPTIIYSTAGGNPDLNQLGFPLLKFGGVGVLPIDERTQKEDGDILFTVIPQSTYSIVGASGADQVCQNNNGCAIDSTGKVIKSSDLTTNTALTCQKCFNAGESIEFFDSNNQKLIRICDPSSANVFYDQLACNNSVSDTLACMVNGKADATNPDGTPSNYTLCCKCRVSGGVWTGIGCTDTTPLGLITGIIRIVFGVVGGVALLQLIIAGIMYQTGDEARIKTARENIIKTLTGLAVLVFSILILRVIGINILDVIPAGSV